MNYKITFTLIAVTFIGLIWFLNTQNTPSESQMSDGEAEQDTSMSFFVTSINAGSGADFGGINGADFHCQALAFGVEAGDKTWKAYLSNTAVGGEQAINARDRIGSGPWYNFNGELIASSVEDLHTNNNINKATALSEKGEVVNGRGDTPNVHDILTGSLPDGTASLSTEDTTCSNWTSSAEGSAIVGHHDRIGLDESEEAKSWNSSHGSRGCSLENLNSTGGGGLLYCFATN